MNQADLPVAMDAYEQTIRSGEPVQVCVRHEIDGEQVWMSVLFMAIHDEGNLRLVAFRRRSSPPASGRAALLPISEQ